MEKNRNFYDYKVFTFIIRSMVLWWIMCAWWGTVFTFLPIDMDKNWLYMGTCLVACIVNLLLESHRKKMLIPIVCVGVGIYVWWNRALLFAAVGHLVNTFLANFYSVNMSLQVNQTAIADVRVRAMLYVMMSIPVVVGMGVVLRNGTGRLLSVTFVTLPFIAAASELRFPTVAQSANLVMAAAVFYALSGCNNGLMLFKKSVISVIMAGIVVGLALFTGQQIEAAKVTHAAAYVHARTTLEDTIAKQIRGATLDQLEKLPDNQQGDMSESEIAALQSSSEDMGTQDNSGDQTQAMAEQMIEQMTEQVQQSTEQSQSFAAGEVQNNSTAGQSGYGGLSDLKSIAYFEPATGDLGTVTVSEKPTKTVYVGNSYGEDYDGASWSARSDTDELLFGDSVAYNKAIRLVTLCRQNPVTSLAEAESFIRSELEANTVYSYTPGATPADKDFAEYFLFDNKKGFCVHFATTAVLMYRIYGYAARLAEGYAIPATAFEQQADGTWQAKVLGTMGHAWCEVYDNGSWIIKEHTLSYTGDEAVQENPPAVSATREEVKKSEQADAISAVGKVVYKTVTTLLKIVAVIACVLAVFYLQAKIRRERLKNRLRAPRRKRIQNIYAALYKMAVFVSKERKEAKEGMQVKPTDKDVLCRENYDFMQSVLVDITAEEWQSMYELVLESVFGNRVADREELDRMRQIYLEEDARIRGWMNRWQKVKYRYWWGLG